MFTVLYVLLLYFKYFRIGGKAEDIGRNQGLFEGDCRPIGERGGGGKNSLVACRALYFMA